MMNDADRYNDYTRCVWWQKMLLLFVMLHATLFCFSQGIPVIRNFLAKDYHANNINLDITTGNDGTVYVANFEGLMYYDKSEWRIIHTPGMTRVTVVFRDSKDVIWAGGYNYFGRVEISDKGELYLKRYGNSEDFRGEVVEIMEENGEINFFVSNGNLYQIKDGKLSVKKAIKGKLSIGLTDAIKVKDLQEDNKAVLLTDTINTELLGNGMKATAFVGNGVSITDENGHELYRINEDNGLCSSSVVWISYDGHGALWGATSEGVFAIGIPSAFSHFTAHEGLTGEVLGIKEFDGKKYVGTLDGLFRQEGRKFERIPQIRYACWNIIITGNELLAATADGIYRISSGKVQQLTSTESTAIFSLGRQFYSGESDGLYLIDPANNIRKKVCNLKKVTKIIRDREGTIWLQNIYGEVWFRMADETSFRYFMEAGNEETAKTLVQIDGKVMTVSADSEEPFPYPLFSYTDDSGVTWLTNNTGKSLYRWKDGQRQSDLKKILHLYRDMTVRAMLCKDNEIWIGGNDGLWVIDKSQSDTLLDTKPHMLLRTVRLRGDSILWGGYGEMPDPLPELESNERNLHFTYALDYVPLVGKTLYRYKLNDGKWSSWEEDNEAEFLNLHYGSYSLTVQAMLPTGELSEETTINFSIRYPFYVRWYMVILYIILLLFLIAIIIQWRLHRLREDKILLENIVQERTAEVVQQKDEIEEKSKSLEAALKELGEAQHELIRQEKMATVGKLTQGLIDRILNPLNYINNFSKLSEGLVKDVKANVEDEKEHMSEDNYEDTMDVLDMLSGNLQKVGEHGQSTSRTLKAMEEMLKDRTGGIIKMDLTNLFRQNEEMLTTYYAKQIQEHHIKTVFEYPSEPVFVKANPELLSKVFMSLLGNSMYAVVKKAQKPECQPEVSLKATASEEATTIVIYDTGTGIGEKIIDKIFDPFFTTKTTGEASGIGLYLSHDIIQNYGGNITVKSVKGEFTEFTITLPILKE